MSKGSKRRSGNNYQDNYDAVFKTTVLPRSNGQGLNSLAAWTKEQQEDDGFQHSKREQYEKLKPKTALDEKREKFLSIHKTKE